MPRKEPPKIIVEPGGSGLIVVAALLALALAATAAILWSHSDTHSDPAMSQTGTAAMADDMFKELASR